MYYAIITAGGSGLRMGSDMPKQFLDLGGEPILRRTVDLFLSLPFEVKIIIAMNREHSGWWQNYCHRKDFFFRHYETAGGITRFHSVQEALKYVGSGGVAAVHDGVRPLVSSEQIIRLYRLAEEYPAVIPALPLTDSIRFNDSGCFRVADRTKYIAVQTPQVFRSDILLDSYTMPYRESFTDDASVVEAKGYPLHFCEGERYNIKITTREDLSAARCLLGRKIVDPDLSLNGFIQ